MVAQPLYDRPAGHPYFASRGPAVAAHIHPEVITHAGAAWTTASLEKVGSVVIIACSLCDAPVDDVLTRLWECPALAVTICCYGYSYGYS